MDEYRLISEEYAFAGPIRSVCIGPSSELVLGSQSDSPCIRRYSLQQDDYHHLSFTEVGNQIFHDHWVVAVSSLPPNVHPAFPEGCIVTGCMDNKIRFFSPHGTPLLQLQGHTKGVISFSWTGDNNTSTSSDQQKRLISGSWDGTARIWSFSSNNNSNNTNGEIVQGKCDLVLGPHENGVHVLGLSDRHTIITTSTGESVNDKPANFQIRVWDSQSGQQIHTPIQDHAGPIRSVTAVTGVAGYATCSNDGSVILREIESHGIIGSMHHRAQDDGSAPFLLDVCCLPTATGMDIVSCGEDGSVCVWQGTELRQCIPHPSSVWCAIGIPSIKNSSCSSESIANTHEGDFITCGHDGFLRLFSKHISTGDIDIQEEQRIQALQSQFEHGVAENQARKRSGPNQEEISKAAKWEQRGNHPGKSEGQVMVFNKENRMIAAQWSTDSQAWIEIGEVTGNSDGGVLDGEQYDHIMPVEIDAPGGGGTMNLKLGYNNLENPYNAAQRFIDKNELPGYHLKTIADWIMARTGSNQAPTIGNNSSSTSQSSPSSAITKSTMSYKLLPLKACVVHDEIPTGFKSKLMQKIVEFNTIVIDSTTVITASGSGSNASMNINKNVHSLSVGELEMLTNLATTLEDTSHYHSSNITVAQLMCIDKVLSWSNLVQNNINSGSSSVSSPTSAVVTVQSFPGYDLLRLIAIHPNGAKTLADFSKCRKFFESALQLVTPHVVVSSGTVLCAIRFLQNALRYEDLKKALFQCIPMDSLLNVLRYHLATNAKGTGKPLRVATIHVLMNCSLSMNLNSIAVSSSITVQHCINLISILIEAIELQLSVIASTASSETSSSSSSSSSSSLSTLQVESQEILLKELLAVGTCLFLHRSGSHAVLASTANQLQLRNKLVELNSSSSVAALLNENIKICVSELLSLL